jgi:carbon-monoxide dehydrogenase small subunit
VCACLVLAATAVDVPIVSIEGIAGDDGAPSDVQQAFVDAGAVQCGFCTPGLVMAAHDLLGRIADPTPIVIAEELSGNICRCTGYGRIVAAVQQVAVSRRSPATQAVAGSALPFGHAGGTPFGHAGGAGASSLAPEARS